ncbi:kelch-like protein 3 isoform X1 [Aphis gossypii]|uniref:kelch-like protein 3 isoform X1 n=1 Tax=Aphis gossypii TaxID=80765 RepID=UPI002159066A|nr:kelch-like protein 3 isoform X1 [Aphis gossypii]
MASLQSKDIRLSQGVESIPKVLTNVFLKIPIGICYQKFDEMRRNKELCDIKIVAKNGEEIWAHKVVLAANSEYFNIMFNSQFKESKELEIKIQELDPYVLSSLIDFIYSSELVVNEQNIKEIIEGICFLQLDETICNKCVEYIKSRIEPSNCLGIKEMAECLGLKDLCLFCLTYASIKFSDVYKNEEFLHITLNELIPIIKNEDLCVAEEKVYESVIKWIKHDRENRNKHLPDLMKYVRLPIISQEFLESTVDKELLLEFNKNSREYLDGAYPVHGTELKAPNSIRTQYRSNYSEYVLVMGISGSIHHPLLYNVITNQWKTVSITIPLNSYGLTVLLNDGRLFSVGGVCYTTRSEHLNNLFHVSLPLNSCHIFDANTKHWRLMKRMLNHPNESNIVQIGSRIYVPDIYDSEYYDIENDKWFKMNSINLNRTDYAVIALNGFIYAVGGNLTSYGVEVVEQFDPKTNTWKQVASMLKGRVAPTLCVLNSCMYAIGGRNYGDIYLSSVEKYDPSTDSWEKVTNLNHSRSNAGAVTVNGLIYVFGGEHSNFTIEVYCPYKKTWSVLSSKVPDTFDNYGCCNAFNVKRHIQNEVLKLTD